MSPACNRLGGLTSGKNSLVGVCPINCHPPYVDIGYTPVCIPAIPTAPVGMVILGEDRLGVAIFSDSPPRNGKPEQIQSYRLSTHHLNEYG